MNPTELRAAIEYLDACLEQLVRDSDGNVRSLEPDEQTRFDEGLAMREQYARDLAQHERIANLAAVPANTERAFDRGSPAVHTHRSVEDVINDRSVDGDELADTLTRALEPRVSDADNMAHVRATLTRHLVDVDEDSQRARENREWARDVLARSTRVYHRAWAKAITGRANLLSDEERAAFQVGVSADGGYLLPTHLDPTLIITNAGTSNVVRGMSRVATQVVGNTWHGVTSAGVTASWDTEIQEVSDDTPNDIGNPSVPLNKAQAFIQASIEALQDTSVADDLLMLFSDARDRLEGAAHCTGLGSSNQPKGVFTAIAATSANCVVSTTAAVIGEVDVHALYRALPVRWRGRGTFLMNPLYSLAIKRLGTALSSSYTGNLTEAVTDRILNRPAVDSDDAPTTQTTTALDSEVIFGDFSQYLIIDKPASMSVEYVPHLFNVTTNLPDGRRGWYCYWRTGADAVNPKGFRLLQDRTSA